MSNGRDICDRLRELRRQVAEKYGLEYNPTECHHEDDCAGTCPACDIELFKLQSQLEAKGIRNIDVRLDLPEDETNDFEIDENAMPGIPADNDMAKQTENPEEYVVGNMIMPPMMRHELLTLCYIAGLQFHDIEKIWPKLNVGTRLALVRDRNNKYDRNAVAVALESDYDGDSDNFNFNLILGYIPRRNNEEIAELLDEGIKLFGEIRELNEHAHYSHRILIGVCVDMDDQNGREFKRWELSKVLTDNELLDKAALICISNHTGQVDKAGQAYFQHPMRVAMHCATTEQKIVALLHDTIEDTSVTPEYLLELGFSKKIVDAILSVTKRDDESYEDFVKRAARNPIGRVVKLRDLEDNLDVSRLDQVKTDDAQRLTKYLAARRFLMGYNH
jgi:ethanolamine utilization protein EutP (predicted NTPase)